MKNSRSEPTMCNFKALPFGPRKEDEYPRSMSFDQLYLQFLLEEDYQEIDTINEDEQIKKELRSFRDFFKTKYWVITGINTKVERVDGNPISSEEQYELGAYQTLVPKIGEKISIVKQNAGLQVNVLSNELDYLTNHWTVTWEEWFTSSLNNCSGGKSIFGKCFFQNNTITSTELWNWKAYCTSHGVQHHNMAPWARPKKGCGSYTEHSIVGMHQTLTIKEGVLIWKHSKIRSFIGLNRPLKYKYNDDLFQDLNTTWTCKATMF